MACKELEKDLAVDKWTLGDFRQLYIECFFTWDKSNRLDDDRNAYLVLDKCVNFQKEILFDLVKCIQRKHRSVFQGHLKYTRNGIVKAFRVRILCYAERIQEMHDLVKNLPPPLIKGKSFEEAGWKFRGKNICY